MKRKIIEKMCVPSISKHVNGGGYLQIRGTELSTLFYDISEALSYRGLLVVSFARRPVPYEWLDSIRASRAADVKSLLASKLGRHLSIEDRIRSKEGLALSKEGRVCRSIE